MSPPRTRRDWELGVQQILLGSGASLRENDPEDRLRDLWNECWDRRLSCSETAARMIELLWLGPRKAWENEVDRGMKELVMVGVEEAWPDIIDRAWEEHQRPAATAREICRLLHDKFDVGYLADALDPWHPGGGPQR